jgi:hypothetical protein
MRNYLRKKLKQFLLWKLQEIPVKFTKVDLYFAKQAGRTEGGDQRFKPAKTQIFEISTVDSLACKLLVEVESEF